MVWSTRDLVCLLRTRSLAELGVPLAQIGDVSGGATDRELLQHLDAEPAAQIARLTQAMVETMVELYNPAQLDVFGRASLLAQELLAHEGGVVDDGAADDGAADGGPADGGPNTPS